MTLQDLQHVRPVAVANFPSAQERLMQALDGLHARLADADATPLSDVQRLLDDLTRDCDRARGAALLLFGERK